MGKSGAQGSGKVEYPTYMETIHDAWLTDAENLIDPYITGGSPYAGETSYDPDAEIDEMVDEVSTFKADVFNVTSKWNDYISQISSDKTTLYPGVDTDVQTIDTYAQGQATSYIDTILTEEWEDFVNRSKSELALLNANGMYEADEVSSLAGEKSIDQLNKVDNNFAEMLKLRVGQMIIEAIEASYSGGVDELVDEDVKAFEDSSSPELMRSLSRLAAGCADINAVHTSSFVMAGALLEDDFQKRLASRRSEVKERYVNAAIQSYMSTYGQMLIEYVRMSIGNPEGSFVSLYDSSVKNSSAFQSQAVQSMLSRLDLEIQSKMQMYSEGYKNYIGAYVSDEKSKSIFQIESMNQLTRLLSSKIDLDKSIAMTSIDVYKNWIIAKKEQVDKDLELDLLDAQWPFEVLQYGGNVLASIAGAAHTVNKPQSTAQSAMAGLASGAAMGAQFGPWGAGIGGAVGLIGSLL